MAPRSLWQSNWFYRIDPDPVVQIRTAEDLQRAEEVLQQLQEDLVVARESATMASDAAATTPPWLPVAGLFAFNAGLAGYTRFNQTNVQAKVLQQREAIEAYREALRQRPDTPDVPRRPAEGVPWPLAGVQIPFFPNMGVTPPEDSSGGPMATFKINLFFSLGKAGWSETWYTRRANIDVALRDARGLAQARAALLASDVNFDSVRVSDEAIFGDSDVIPNPTSTRFNGSTPSDEPYNAALCRIQATSVYRRQLYLRGVPVGVAKPNSPADNLRRGLWLLAVQNFAKQVIDRSSETSGFCLRVHLRGGDNPARYVQRFVDTLTGYDVVFFVGVPTGIVAGDTLQIYTVREFPTLQGRFPVESVSGNTVSILYPNPQPFTYRGRAYGRRVGLGTAPIDDLKFERFVTKRVGRPFDSPVGRRKRRRLPVI